MPLQEPISSSHSQHRSVKSRIARYLRRTTLSSFAVLASQISTTNNSQVQDIYSSTLEATSSKDIRQQDQCLCRQESETSHSLRTRSNTTSGSYAMLPIDEGFHQSQQKTLSSTVSQEEEEKSGAAYKYGKSHSSSPVYPILYLIIIIPRSPPSSYYISSEPPFSLIQILLPVHS